MVTNNSMFENQLINWLFTDTNSTEIEITLVTLSRAYINKKVSKDFYVHYSFMLNIKLKKFKLLETLQR